MDQKICPICKNSAGVNQGDAEQSILLIYCSQCGKFNIDSEINLWFKHDHVSSEMLRTERYGEIFGNSENIQGNIFNDAMRKAMSTLVKGCGGTLTLNKELLPGFVEAAYNACQKNGADS